MSTNSRDTQVLAADDHRRSYARDVSTIERFWLMVRVHRSTRALAQDFCHGNGPKLDVAKTITFDELAVVLRGQPLIDASGRMLMRMVALCNYGKPNVRAMPWDTNVKIFLAAYMIASRPKHVFETMGELEHNVLDASEPMIRCFYRMTELLSSGRSWGSLSRDTRQGIAPLMHAYFKTFKEWKIVDEKKLAGRLKHALTGLEDAEACLNPREDNHDTMRAELQEQQLRMRAKLVQIAGDKELALYDSERAAAGKTPAKRVLTGQSLPAPKRQAVEEKETKPGVSNEQLAHELLVDEEFVLDEKACMTADRLVRMRS